MDNLKAVENFSNMVAVGSLWELMTSLATDSWFTVKSHHFPAIEHT